MTVFTYSQARQKFAAVLDLAKREGYVQIRRKDGAIFTICPAEVTKKSPLDIEGIDTKATTSDILAAIKDSRSR